MKVKKLSYTLKLMAFLFFSLSVAMLGYTPKNALALTATPRPATATFTSTPTPSGSCKVLFKTPSVWDGGFTADVTIINNGSAPIQGWQLGWNFNNGATVQSFWNVKIQQTNTTVTAQNSEVWNSTIAANGGSVNFGFNGNGTATIPQAFSLNGMLCGDATPTPTSTATITPTSKADLVITNAWWGGQLDSGSPSCWPLAKIIGVGHLTIANQGNEASGSFVVSFGGKTQIVSGLLAGKTMALSLIGASLSPAPVIDVDNQVTETNEDNNTFTAPIFVSDMAAPPPCTPTPTYTPTPTDGLSPTPTGTGADLIILSKWLDVRALSCEYQPTGPYYPGTGSITIGNQGSAAAGSFVVSIGTYRQTVPGLAAGQSITLNFSGVDIYSTAIADADNQVAESNENNNTFAMNSNLVTATPGPTCTPKPATPTPTYTPTPTATPTQQSCSSSPVASASLSASATSVKVGDTINLVFGSNVGMPQYTLSDGAINMAVYRYSGGVTIYNESPVLQVVNGVSGSQVRAIAPGTAVIRVSVSGELPFYQLVNGICYTGFHFTGAASQEITITVSGDVPISTPTDIPTPTNTPVPTDTPTPTATATSPASSCKVDYKLVNSWDNGLTGNFEVTISNLADSPIQSWNLGWNSETGQGKLTITNIWGAVKVSESNSTLVKNEAWNGTIGAKGNVTFGMTVHVVQGTLFTPQGFTLNDTVCQ